MALFPTRARIGRILPADVLRVIDITIGDAYRSGMEIHLTPEQQAFIEQGVRNGRFASHDDAMREAVTLLETRERELAQTRAFVREGLDDLDAGRYEDYTDESLHELFDGIKHRGRERLAAEEPSKP